MKIRARLKDVILIPENPYEEHEIVRITYLVREDPNAEVALKIDIPVGEIQKITTEPPGGTFYLKGLHTQGIVKNKQSDENFITWTEDDKS